jgi:hypothetical protein
LIVVEVAVAVADAAEFFDDQVDGFGGAVIGAAGGAEREDFVTLGVDDASEPGELWDLGVGGVLEEHDQSSFRVGEIFGGVDLDEEFACEPDGGDFAVGVTGCEPGT